MYWVLHHLIWRPLPLRRQLPGQAGIRSDVDGAILGVDHHARLGAAWLFDEAHGGHVHGHVLALAALGEPGGQLGGLGDGVVRGWTPVQG